MHDGHGVPHHHHEDTDSAPNRAAAVLGYMLEHNRHHADELRSLADTLESGAAALVLQSVAAFDDGNAKLAAALELLKASREEE